MYVCMYVCTCVHVRMLYVCIQHRCTYSTVLDANAERTCVSMESTIVQKDTEDGRKGMTVRKYSVLCIVLGRGCDTSQCTRLEERP